MKVCVLLPYFAAAVEQQYRPDLSDELLVLRSSTGAVPRIVAVSKSAAQLDIHQGMSLSHAQTLVPELQALPLCPPRYRIALDKLLDTLSTFSDQVEIIYNGWGAGDEKIPQSLHCAALSNNPAVAFLDFGSLKPQALRSLGQQLQAALKLNHFSAQVGVATNRFTAWVAALAAREESIAIVPDGEEKWMLTCHPVSLLPLDAKIQRRLGLLGIRNLGDFANLPRAAMRAQFGEQGVVAYQLAHGIDPTPIQRLSRERVLNKSFEFEGEVWDREILNAVLKGLVGNLLHSLETSGETARKVRLTLTLSNRGACEFEARLRQRTSASIQIYDALQKLLDKAAISTPVVQLSISLGDIVTVAARQLELFPMMVVVESQQAVLDDLIARYGKRFYFASFVDDIEAFQEVQSA